MNQIIATLLKLFKPTTKRPTPTLSPDGAWLLGLDIVHRKADAGRAFGKFATRSQKPFVAVVAHHPAVPQHWLIENTLSLINRPRADGHMYGYHFLIDVDGTIHQAAPLTKRTNHVKTKASRRKFGSFVTNRNAIGLCFQHADHNPNMAPNEAQMKAGARLLDALQIACKCELSLFGHGEIQTDKNPFEGEAFAKRYRQHGP